MLTLKLWKTIVAVLLLSALSVSLLAVTPTTLLAQPEAISQEVKKLVANADQCLRQESRKHLAIGYINRAIQLQPTNLQLYYKRAFIYGKLKYYTEALKNLDFVIRNDPARRKFPSALKYRAECYAAIGDYEKALADYRTFLRKSRKAGKIWYSYAELLWFLGDREQALGAVENGLRTGSHWQSKLESLRNKIITGTRVQLHTPFSN